MAKIGRNQPCPCGSGKKYKKCCLDRPRHTTRNFSELPSRLQEQMKLMIKRHEAKEAVRISQQGLGKSILSAESNGYRIVFVKNTMHYSKTWKTFHDFLLSYLRNTLGKEWWLAELAKPESARHPIVIWYTMLTKQLASKFTEGKVNSADMTGAIAAYLQLSYNLFLLKHNLELQQHLLTRLKSPVEFGPACYETFVFGIFIRAGFEITLENEQDGQRRHPEFVATHKETGRKFSVEAKRIQSANPYPLRAGKVGIQWQLVKALKKPLAHERVVFVDLNDSQNTVTDKVPDWIKDAYEELKRIEGLPDKGNPLPPAFVFITNVPYEHHLETTNPARAVYAHGFKIPDFSYGPGQKITLREAINSQEKHAVMLHIIDTLKRSNIPSTFDGSDPHLAFSEQPPRLLIGETYNVQDEAGNIIEAVLQSGTVSETENSALVILNLKNGKQAMVRHPLTEEEMAAYYDNPDYFFGVYHPAGRRVNNALEMYNFFYAGFKDTPKERLLKLMENYPNIEELKSLPRDELASIYCENCAATAAARNEQEATPTSQSKV